MLKNREAAKKSKERKKKPQSWPGGPAKGVGDGARNIIKTSKITAGWFLPLTSYLQRW
jgi:hypothetical protein